MKITVSARVINFPRTCACCVTDNPENELEATATRTTGKRVIRTTTNSYSVPYCDACVHHVNTWEDAKTQRDRAIIIAVLLSIIFGILASSFALAAVIFTITMIFGMRFVGKTRERARQTFSERCASIEQAVLYDGWDGSLKTLDFTSMVYAKRFMMANAGKLVELGPEARKLFEESLEEEKVRRERELADKYAKRMQSIAEAKPRSEREAPSRRTEASATSDNEAEALLRWVTKLEGLKGPAARRTALEAGLQALKQQSSREKLLVEASKIEVQAALDKADQLKTVAAKKRTLQAALDAIKTDSVPDDLQAQQIKWLEEALALLDGEEN